MRRKSRPKLTVQSRRPTILMVIPFPLKIVASVVAVIVGLGILYSTTSLVSGPRVNFASLDTGISSRIERVIDSTVSVSREILLNIAMPPAEDDEAVTVAATAQQTAPVGRYILVVGSFPTEKAARSHIAQCKDEAMKISRWTAIIASTWHLLPTSMKLSRLHHHFRSVIRESGCAVADDGLPVLNAIIYSPLIIPSFRLDLNYGFPAILINRRSIRRYTDEKLTLST